MQAQPPSPGEGFRQRLASQRGPRLALAVLCMATAPAIAADAGAAPRAAPQQLDRLRGREFATRLRFERELDAGDAGPRTRLVSWQVDGLRQYALVAVPRGPRPPAGFPVLVANHGTHPDPPRYGFTAAGVDSRPGDYYRPVPASYAAAGFLVVMPDYRGHNASEGAVHARGHLAAAYFAADVLSLLAGLRDLPEADTDNVFLWGHSLGGDVTLRALLALPRVTGVRVRAAAIWSTVGGSVWERAAYFARSAATQAAAGGDDGSGAGPRALAAVDALRAELAALATPYDPHADEPLSRIAALDVPLLLQHGLGDRTTPYEWSERLAVAAWLAGRPLQLVAVPTADHFFDGVERERAVARDVAFFHASMQPVMQDRAQSPGAARRGGGRR
jgi:dipeptidyl aminopeptidase/acylaminoacyl peptidase